jgi:ABC-type transporter Mla MlaB component
MAGDDPGVSTVVLTGPATIYESSEVRETLLAALTDAKDLRIDLETSGPWDLAGFQLLLSAVASGQRTGRSVRFVNVPRVCSEVAERSGLGDWLRAAADSLL